MIEPRKWHDEIAALAESGARFAALYGAEAGSRGKQVTAVLELDGKLLARSCLAPNGKVPTLLDLFPAAAWDEREAHDLYGIDFLGHDPLRPLVEHSQEPRSWMIPVSGAAVHQVAVGPIHAGVIESGHFRFHLVGERILGLDLRLFYKHRGIERLAEGTDEAGSLAVVARTCASSSVAIQVTLAQCWERYLGLRAGPELARARTILIELERLYNHLNDIGAICAGVGYSPGAMAFAAFKERIQRLNQSLFGHRFLFGTIEIGGSAVAVDERQLAAARDEIEAIRVEAAAAWREILFSTSIQDRFRGTGVVSAEAATRLGLVGPAARASGIRRDRRALPETGLAYPEDFKPAELQSPDGDVAARSEIRAVEIEAGCRLLAELLEGSLKPAEAIDAGEPDREDPAGSTGAGKPYPASVEGPRGEIVGALEVDSGRVRRFHLRTASYANWPALSEAVIGDILPDFPLINKSFELSYAAVDR